MTAKRRSAGRHSGGYITFDGQYVHRIVCRAWHGPPPTPQHEVNHKDFDKTNNHPDNLEWVTRVENVRHAARAGRVGGRKGAAHPQSVLTEDDVRSIQVEYAAGVGATQRSLAKKYGVTSTTIYGVLTGKTWGHLFNPDGPQYSPPRRNSWKAILTEQGVREIRASTEPQPVLAARYGVSRQTISAVKCGTIWRHLT